MKEIFLAARYIPLAFSALFPVINPIGSAVLFLGFVQDAGHPARKLLARKIAINTIWFLMVVLIVGTLVLRFFGISLPVVQVAGGFVLATMGWSLLNKPDTPAAPATDQQSLSSLENKAFFPLTFPLTAGPACVVVTLTLGAHASRGRPFEIVLAHLGVLVGIVLMGVLVYLSYAYADRTTARLSPSMTQGILRIISFILLCIGAEIMWNGIQALARSVH